MDPFVLLDDAPAARTELLTELVRTDRVTFSTIDEALQRGWRERLHAFTWLPYGLGEAELDISPGTGGALFWFRSRTVVDAEAWLPSSPAWLSETRHTVDPSGFATQIDAVREAIAAGETYQINYTHRVTSRAVGDPRALYRRLRRRQPVRYGALAHLPGPAAPWTLCLSPELFIHVEDGVARSKPMKGTAPVSQEPTFLSHDPKNRAENLMIVDLLRNDLSRIAVPGTVAVPALFEVEQVGRLWQMTSTVQAQVQHGITPGALLAATFPCGSITGAPKIAAMHLIRELEPDPRGLYTGSMGLIEPEDSELGWKMKLNIAIRTVEIDDAGNARLGVGSGVVADSTADEEWAECLAKAAFASSLAPNVHLREAIRVIDGVAPLAVRHQARLSRSAEALGFPPLDGVVERAVAAVSPVGSWRLHLDVSPDGNVATTSAKLEPTTEPVVIIISRETWTPSPLARHKTDDRPHFDRASAEAASHGAFDAIGLDAEGRVLEGARTNVFALIAGRWLTPPLNLGVLDGVQRAAILAQPELIGATHIHEAEFTVDDLLTAERVVVTNALRGPLTAKVVTP